ncbi:MAG: hypothetical protein COY39_05160 [Alphaproteobacteria bacterium CG_4_10_14_0_8_um_filter_37_21]|nr:MAG: hypothetical protein COY39_05160 [Alphaproteobacteria bacterium CG_4_10_14_0_8_um_filter_37_21]
MNFMPKLLAYGSVFCLSLLSTVQTFGYEAKIIAVVDKKAITERDLEDRIRLVLFTSNQSDTPQMRQKMRAQILESMIVEKLQLKAAIDGKVTISKKDVHQAVHNIASQNNMNHQQLMQMFKSNNISIKSLEDRLYAQLAWDAVVNYGLGGINISEKEVDKILNAEKASDILFDVSEIVLYPTDASKRFEAKKQAEDMLQQLKSGASFNALAQQFSQSTTARKGGHLGRLSSANLSSDLLAALNNMKASDVRIIEIPKGVQIIRLNSKKQALENGAATVSFKVVLVPFDEDMNDEQQYSVQAKIDALRLSSSVSQFMKSSSEMGFAIKTVDALDIESTGSKEFSAMLQQAKVGDILKPIRQEGGFQLIYVTKKAIKPYQPLTRKEITQQLEFQKKNMTAAMFLNKLRARTFITNHLSGDHDTKFVSYGE